MQPAYAVLGEPTGLGLCYGHDGWVRLDCRIKGADRHTVRQAATLVMHDIEDAADAINGRASERLRATGPEWNKGAQPEAVIRISRPVFPGESTEHCHGDPTI
jgi:acetylornithine deacetylase/succinyl-diaminopimelate desuccinylase-like protein